MLEDDFSDVLRKAMLGRAFKLAGVARCTGLEEAAILDFLNGGFSVEVARRLAGALGLKEEAFARHDRYQPRGLDLGGVERLDLAFEGDRVNAWLIREGDELLLFDAGYDAEELMQVIDSLCNRLPSRVFLTHGHRDHIGALSVLLSAGVPVHAAQISGTIPMKADDIIKCGSILVCACDLSGHAMPSLGYQVSGLSQAVLVTGDALFAGSIGGCPTPQRYQLALERLGHVLGELPDKTVLLPGHGPASTLGEERYSNPFL